MKDRLTLVPGLLPRQAVAPREETDEIQRLEVLPMHVGYGAEILARQGGAPFVYTQFTGRGAEFIEESGLSVSRAYATTRALYDSVGLPCADGAPECDTFGYWSIRSKYQQGVRGLDCAPRRIKSRLIGSLVRLLDGSADYVPKPDLLDISQTFTTPADDTASPMIRVVYPFIFSRSSIDDWEGYRQNCLQVLERQARELCGDRLGVAALRLSVV